MRIAEINMTATGSTGNIMLQIARVGQQSGREIRTFSTIVYSRKPEERQIISNHFYYGSLFNNTLHTILGKLTGLNGCFSVIGTKQLVRELKKYNPDIIHLHNLHQFCINLPMLFRYIKKHKIPVIWTIHDCWTFTGHCPHFTLAKCDKWKEQCFDCPQYTQYPKTYVDASKLMYRLKKKWFSGITDLTVVTPSEWLANLVQESFLKMCRIRVINNGIDLSVFRPVISDFRECHNCVDKKLILGVSFGWNYKKGLDVFIELAKRLDKSYQIVLVGTDALVDQQLPPEIISIHRTHDQRELAEIYSAADLFVNPTREDNYPTVNMESLACGTPVLTFNTGGGPEILDETCGAVVECDDIDEMEKEIIQICNRKPFSEESCINRAKTFGANERFMEYISLYEDITHCI